MTPLLDSDSAAAVMEPPVAPNKRGGGPQSPDARESSSRNSLGLGLFAKSVFPPDLEAEIKRRHTILYDQFHPSTPYEAGLLDEMARCSAQYDEAAKLRVIDAQRRRERAILCWDSDRSALAGDLAARLPRDVARTESALERTKQGVDHLLKNWEGLAGVLRTNGELNDEQRRLTFDLLGIRPELRDGSPVVPAGTDAAALAALIAGEEDRLKTLQEERLFALDETDRAMAVAGMPMIEDAESKRLKRGEATARREYKYNMAELRRVRAEGAAVAASPAPQPPSSSARTAPPPTPPPVAPATASVDVPSNRSDLDSRSTPETAPAPEEPTVAPTPSIPAEVAPAVEPVVVIGPVAVTEPAAVIEPVAVTEPAAVIEPATISEPVAVPPPARPVGNRRYRRAQEQQARKEARRNRR